MRIDARERGVVALDARLGGGGFVTKGILFFGVGNGIALCYDVGALSLGDLFGVW